MYLQILFYRYVAMSTWLQIFYSNFSWAKGENDSRKTEIANLDNFAHSENDARKNEIANLDNFAKSENDGRKQVRCNNRVVWSTSINQF